MPAIPGSSLTFPRLSFLCSVAQRDLHQCPNLNVYSVDTLPIYVLGIQSLQFMLNSALKLGLLLGYSALIAACSSESGPSSYQVSGQAGIGGNLSPAQQTINPDGSAQLQVTAEPGYRTASVSGCGGSLSGSRYTTGPVTSNCTVRAQFELIDYQISAQVENGQISPESATATFGETVEFALTPDQGYRLQGSQASGCNGALQGESYVTGPIESDCTVRVSFEPILVNVSGRISPAAATAVDSDINDARSQPIDNSTLENAQLINNLVTLQGFAVFEADGINPGTGGDPAFENFADRNDEDDYFLTYLQAGQIIRLEIASFDWAAPENSDLDLYLFDANDQIVSFSDAFGSATEELVVPETGQYRVNVYAFTGGSRYVLKILPPDANSAQAGRRADFVPDEMIVKLKPQNQVKLSSDTGQLDLSRLRPGRANLVPIDRNPVKQQSAPNQKAKAGLSRAMSVLREHNPESYRKVMTLREVKKMALEPGVEYAEPNYLLKSLLTPNDPLYTNQWHYRLISLPLAWEISTGQELDREPVIVAVVDTGVVLAHPDLSDQLIAGYDFISDPSRSLDDDGIDNNPDDPGDSTTIGESSWHGTHVAGTIAAASNNGVGGAGVSWGARIMPLRALGKDGAGTNYDIIQSVRYAAGLANDSGTLPARRADIINLSLGGPNESQFAREVYQEARNQGVILIAAAGNENSSSPSYPAAYESVFSVSATDARNVRAPYSNFGSSIALAAPGGDLTRDDNGDGEADGVLSTVARKDGLGNREPRYALFQGTSMAAPHVAGVVALMKAVHPELDPDAFERLLVNGDLTDDIGASGRDNLYGYGLINALKAVQRAETLAGGGALPDWPPLVTTNPESLNLVDTSEASVTLTNEGGGDPSITDARTDVTWLSVTLKSTGTAPELGTYLVSANRTELGAGFYRGRVIFTLDDGSQVELQVFLQEGGASTEGELPPIYALLLDPENDNGEAIAQANAQRDGNGMTYVFEEVPPGRYYLQAGSDLDADSFICQPGEACGLYPILERSQVIEVVDQDLTDLDFVVHILGSATDGNNNQTQAAKTKR